MHCWYADSGDLLPSLCMRSVSVKAKRIERLVDQQLQPPRALNVVFFALELAHRALNYKAGNS